MNMPFALSTSAYNSILDIRGVAEELRALHSPWSILLRSRQWPKFMAATLTP